MVDEILAIDREAFEAFDRQRLLRVLRRAIDEETAEHEGDGGRSTVLRNLVSMIQDMVGLAPESIPPRGRIEDA